MAHVKEFFYDRFVLFVLTINSFITLVTVISVLLRLGGSEGIYTHEYRSNLGLSGIEVGGVGGILSFVLFAVGLYIFHFFLAIKFYKIRKASAWAILLLTTLVLILNIIVVNSLLYLG